MKEHKWIDGIDFNAYYDSQSFKNLLKSINPSNVNIKNAISIFY